LKSSEEFIDRMSFGTRDRGFGTGQRRDDSLIREVCEVYDLLISKGMEQNPAIRRTRAILKATNFPSVTYDGVMTRLRASGRFKKHACPDD
jgi:hypothetical protein